MLVDPRLELARSGHHSGIEQPHHPGIGPDLAEDIVKLKRLIRGRGRLELVAGNEGQLLDRPR